MSHNSARYNEILLINSNNLNYPRKDLAKLSIKINEHKSTAAREKNELKFRRDNLENEIRIQENIIKALVPHSTEHILTSMVLLLYLIIAHMG